MKYLKRQKKILNKRYYGNIVIVYIDGVVIMIVGCKFILRIYLENFKDLVICYFIKDFLYVKVCMQI